MDARRSILYAAFLAIFFCLVLGFFNEWGWYGDESVPVSSNSAVNSKDEPKQSDEQKNAGTVTEEPLQTGNEKDDLESVDNVGGIYRVNVRTNKGARYSTNITIKDLGSNIQITGSYKGIRIPVNGILMGSRTKTSGSWSFSANIPLLFNGSGTATIKSAKSGLIITGQGSGEYFTFEGNGSGSATGSGSRISPAKSTTSGKVYLKDIEKTTSFAAPVRPYPTPSPLNTGAAATAAAIGLAASAGAASRNRVRKNKGLQSSSPDDKRASNPTDLNPGSLEKGNPDSDAIPNVESETKQGGE